MTLSNSWALLFLASLLKVINGCHSRAIKQLLGAASIRADGWAVIDVGGWQYRRGGGRRRQPLIDRRAVRQPPAHLNTQAPTTAAVPRQQVCAGPGRKYQPVLLLFDNDNMGHTLNYSRALRISVPSLSVEKQATNERFEEARPEVIHFNSCEIYTEVLFCNLYGCAGQGPSLLA